MSSEIDYESMKNEIKKRLPSLTAEQRLYIFCHEALRIVNVIGPVAVLLGAMDPEAMKNLPAQYRELVEQLNGAARDLQNVVDKCNSTTEEFSALSHEVFRILDIIEPTVVTLTNIDPTTVKGLSEHYKDLVNRLPKAAHDLRNLIEEYNLTK